VKKRKKNLMNEKNKINIENEIINEIIDQRHTKKKIKFEKKKKKSEKITCINCLNEFSFFCRITFLFLFLFFPFLFVFLLLNSFDSFLYFILFFRSFDYLPFYFCIYYLFCGCLL
jgi:hypothetical protein